MSQILLAEGIDVPKRRSIEGEGLDILQEAALTLDATTASRDRAYGYYCRLIRAASQTYTDGAIARALGISRQRVGQIRGEA